MLAGALALPCSAQFPALPADSLVDLPGRWSNTIALDIRADYNTNSLRNELPWALYQGGYITRAMRERTGDGLPGRNSAGFDATARITWTGADSLFGKARWRPVVSAAHREAFGVKFTDDLYTVTFFGNAPYEDRTAKLGPSTHAHMRYQTLGLGVQDARSGTYLRLDLAHGMAYSTANLSRADVYTGIDGQVIEADVMAEYRRSDTASSATGRTNGMGAALSGRWTHRLWRDGGKPLDIGLGVEDLGFISWNARTQYLRKDTLIAYEGLRIADIFALEDVLIGEEQLMDTFGLRYSSGTCTTLLPFRAVLSFNTTFNSAWHVGLEVEQRNLPGFMPQATLSGARRLGRHLLLGVSVGHGGFGGLRAGLGTRLRIGQRVLVTASTPHLPGFLLGGTKGLGALFGLAAGF